MLQNQTRFREPQAKLYYYEVVLALEFLNRNKIIYRDLKPENVLLDNDGHIKLTDFGLSKDLHDLDQAKTFCGTAKYLAPEMILLKPYGVQIDIWMFGIFPYKLLVGSTPFQSKSHRELYRRIANEVPNFLPLIPPVAADFIRLILQKDPSKRPSWDQILNHPCFSEFEQARALAKGYTPESIPNLPNPDHPIYMYPQEHDDPILDSEASAVMTTNAFNGFTLVLDAPSSFTLNIGDSFNF
jgi:serine/threonine protein kinase